MMTHSPPGYRLSADARILRSLRVAAVVCIPLTAAACASAPLQEGGTLSSYRSLKPSDGMLTKTRQHVDKRAVLAARTVRIVPTGASASAAQSGLTQQQLRLVSNAIDRAVCRDLSSRLEVVPADQPSDLTVRAVITHVGKTDATAAGVSAAVGIGGTVAGAATGVPVPGIRIPIGLGGLAVEAQASGRQGEQVAAMIWARGADAFTTKARAAEEGDAYTLANHFAADLAKLLVTGSDPISDPIPTLPSAHGIGEFFGASPKYAACAQFGKHPGVGDAIGGAIGLPPEWTDSGAQPATAAVPVRP